MKQGTSTTITRNLNAAKHYFYYFKDCNNYILSLCLNEENDLVVLMSLGTLFHSLQTLNLVALYPLSDCI